MPSLPRFLLLLALVAIAGALSWRYLPGFSPRPTHTAAPSSTIVEVPGWTKVSPNGRQQLGSYARIQLIRVFDGEFAALEQEAAAPSFAGIGINGLSPAEAFYGCFDYGDWNDHPEWDRFFGQLDQWETTYPKSPHVLIARAEALTSHAWAARGNGYADTVKTDGWRLFGERLQAASTALDKAQALGAENYPGYWSARLTVALGQNAPAKSTLQLAETALNRFPDDAELYGKVCVYLLPRWHGAPGQWEGWLKNQATHARWGAEGMPPKLYARVVWRVYRYLYDEPIFDHPAVSWSKTLEGLNQLCTEYPESAYWKTARVRLAAGAGDREAFVKAIHTMNGQFDAWAFNSKRFQDALAWGGQPASFAR